jgi:hypothetical protein
MHKIWDQWELPPNSAVRFAFSFLVCVLGGIACIPHRFDKLDRSLDHCFDQANSEQFVGGRLVINDQFVTLFIWRQMRMGKDTFRLFGEASHEDPRARMNGR